jgi:hypothetical protein
MAGDKGANISAHMRALGHGAAHLVNMSDQKFSAPETYSIVYLKHEDLNSQRMSFAAV